MSRSPQKFSSIFLVAMLALPILYVAFILLPFAIYNLLTICFSGASSFFSGFFIFLLILHLSPPPPNKKKRILFVQKFKALLKRFRKQNSTEKLVFKDDIVHFAEYDHGPNSNPEVILSEFILPKNLVSESSSITSNFEFHNVSTDTYPTKDGTLRCINQDQDLFYLSNSIKLVKKLKRNSAFAIHFKKSPLPNCREGYFSKWGVWNFSLKNSNFNLSSRNINNPRGENIG